MPKLLQQIIERTLASQPDMTLAPVERVAAKPSLALAEGYAQFMDLAGDGQPDLVVMEGPVAGHGPRR